MPERSVDDTFNDDPGVKCKQIKSHFQSTANQLTLFTVIAFVESRFYSQKLIIIHELLMHKVARM